VIWWYAPLLPDRFEITGDEWVFKRLREMSFVPPDDSQIWLRGLDRATGARVIIEPRRSSSWTYEMRQETVARLVMSAEFPFAARVVHVWPGVVYSEPPPGRARKSFSPGEAAALALELCEATVRLHAAGITELCFDHFNLRVVDHGARYGIHWLVPGSAELDSLVRDDIRPIKVFHGRTRAILLDAVGILDFFFAMNAEDPESSSASAEVRALWRLRDRLGSGEHLGVGFPPDVAALARLFLPIASVPAEAADRVMAMPSIQSLPPLRFDWDQVISDGHAELASKYCTAREEITLALAAAHHQRASRAWIAGDRASALADAEQAVALDGEWLPHTTTQAVILDALGRSEEAPRSLDEALERAVEEKREHRLWPVDERREVSRAYAARGMIAFRRGALAEAERDLRRAIDLHPSALYAHCHGAALYALGDTEGAAVAEARSVELCPTNARYRWALVGSLRKLGRHAEALAHAEAIVAMEPGNSSHMDKLAILSGTRQRE
jgi:tetratricopeptide (TPR) repeat protein